jgi:hypothetical protein
MPMSENVNPVKTIPDPNHKFQIDVIGKVTGKRFLGDFTSTIPRLKEQGMINKHEAYLNGDMAQFLAPGTRKLHQMIAYLRYTLKEYPSFWKESDLGYELMDLNVIIEVYDEVLRFEEEWMKKVWGDGTDQA